MVRKKFQNWQLVGMDFFGVNMKSNIRNEDNSYTELATEVHNKFRESVHAIVKEYASKMHTDDIQMIGINCLAMETTFAMMLQDDY